ncbi:MAG: SusC/RagA family TonB-linked outer membrane protein [Bacteroidetes bacterium]|nr:SusC/RagA family TonB-linked outer membrane protein [Bacteroidota bacterium]
MKGLLRLFLPVLAGILLVHTALASPPIRISGTIRDVTSHQPLAGASVKAKGSTRGTSTDAEGKFTLELNNEKAIIVSAIGYETLEIPLTGRNDFSIDLKAVANDLNEVVVVGYGTQKKGEVTSAIASVKAENFVKGAVRDAAQLIQGKVAGLTVSTSSGDPTAGTQIQLRGITTLQASTQPLVLIDGIPGNLNSVAPEDIEQIDVLKDGSAAAIYGTRGTNGVILITTKKVHGEGRSTVSYDGYASVQTIARKPQFLDAADYRKYKAQGYGFQDFGTSTDWFKAVTRTPWSSTHNLSLQGGNRQTSYTASINWRDWDGLFLKSDNRQLTGRVDITHNMMDGKVKFNVGAITRTRTYWEGADGGSFNGYVYRQAVIRNPTDSIKDYLGNWKEQNVYFYDNPVAYIMETLGQTREKENRIYGSVTVTPIDGLHLKLLMSNVRSDNQRGYSETKKHVSTVKNGRNGYASLGEGNGTENLLELTGDYTKSFGAHKFTLLGGYSYQDGKSEDFYMQNWDFPTDQYSYNRMQSGNALGRGEAVMNSSASSYKLIGFFGRLEYSWNDKYILRAIVRHEGSSRFGMTHKWGTFPAVSLGWRISSEDFMKNLTFINDLKLRAGYGVTGTAPDASYISLTSLNYGARFLYNGNWIQGLSPARNPNPDLKWERKGEYNIGLDFSMFKGALSGSIDLYKRETNDMLWNFPVPVPPYLFSTITTNAGKTENKGVEILVNYTPFRSKTFEWTTGANFSTNSNKIVSLSNDVFKTTTNYVDAGATGEPIQTSTHRLYIGRPVGDFYGFKSIDITPDGKWIIEGADGKPKPISANKNEDKKILGNGLPKYYAGWNNNFRYKNFDLSVVIRGAFKFQILNFQRMFYSTTKNTQYNMLKSAFDKVYGKAVLTDDLYFVSEYIENGDYVKIDNVTFGYTIPVKNKYIRNVRVYAAGLNLATITGYKGIDPEVSRTGGSSDARLTPGNDQRDKYPTTRTFTIGANVTF